MIDLDGQVCLTRDEAASALTISKVTLGRLIRDGTIVAVTHGGRQLIAVEEVQRVLSTRPSPPQTVTPDPQPVTA